MNIPNLVVRCAGACIVASAVLGLTACGQPTEAVQLTGEAGVPYTANNPATWLSDQPYRGSLKVEGIALDLKEPKEEAIQQKQADAVARYGHTHACVVVLQQQYGQDGRFGVFVFGPMIYVYGKNGTKEFSVKAGPMEPKGYEYDLDADGTNAFLKSPDIDSACHP